MLFNSTFFFDKYSPGILLLYRSCESEEDWLTEFYLCLMVSAIIFYFFPNVFMISTHNCFQAEISF